MFNLKLKSKSLKRSFLSLILVLSILLTIVNPIAYAESNSRNPKSIILLIGDGMGQAHISLARYYKSGQLHMDDMPVSSTMSTSPLPNEEKIVTDSAAAGTAISTGHKTYNGYLGVDKDKKALETILEKSKKAKKSTGLVTTTRLTHATPAAFASHNPDRNDEENIAKEMLNNNVDVLLGGGKNYFNKLITKAEDKSYSYVDNPKDLMESKSEKLLGLFANSHLDYEIDRNKDQPSLANMTKKSLELLSNNPNGLFLMVEGGRIDHSSHNNDPATTAREVLAFDLAVKEALDFAKKDKNTLVIVTADHETGGLSIGANGNYDFKPEILKEQKISLEKLEKLDNIKDKLDLLGVNLKLDKIQENKIEIFKNKINNLSQTGWTTDAHTAIDVPIKAYGPSSNNYTKHMDNTDLNKKMLESLNLN